MRPLDPRLLRWARATRAFLAASVVLGVLTAGLVIAQAVLLADLLTRAFLGGAALAELWPGIIALAVVLATRALAAYGAEAIAHGSAARAKSELRRALVEHTVALGPSYLAGSRSADLATLATRGIDALDAYFARYLPQLALAAVVPLAVGLTIAGHDLPAALIIAVTVPLIPVLMIVIGIWTQARSDRQWHSLQLLSGHFLYVVAGLPTLKVFGRAAAQAQTLREVGDRYRRTTMGVLRVSFLSGLALELVATVSVAVVAVSVGLRLLAGELDLHTALLVLLLAPEVYLPLRLVGVHFHAAADGVTAAERVFAVLETPLPAVGGRTDVPDLRRVTLRLEAVTVSYPGRAAAAVTGLDLEVAPGRVTALVGPSGSGKSTVLSVVLGFVVPQAGRVVLIDRDGSRTEVADLDPEAWRARLAWVPQSPHLVPGTVADNVALGRPGTSRAQVQDALRAAGLRPGDALLPGGADTVVGEGGAGLSVGQRRRVAVARALCRNADLVLLDEPTASLDGSAEDDVAESLAALRATGTTILLVAHRPALVALADHVVTVDLPTAALAQA